MKIDIDKLALPDKHYQDCWYHESSLVCLFLIYRTLQSNVAYQSSDFFHSPWGVLADKLSRNPMATLEELMEGSVFGDSSAIAIAMLDQRSGLPKVFPWNVYWHADQVAKLAEFRRKFNEAMSLILADCRLE